MTHSNSNNPAFAQMQIVIGDEAIQWRFPKGHEATEAEYKVAIDRLLAAHGKVLIWRLLKAGQPPEGTTLTGEWELDLTLFTWCACMDFLASEDHYMPDELARLYVALARRYPKGMPGHYYSLSVLAMLEDMVADEDDRIKQHVATGLAYFKGRMLEHLTTLETRNRMFAPLPEGDTAESRIKIK